LRTNVKKSYINYLLIESNYANLYAMKSIEQTNTDQDRRKDKRLAYWLLARFSQKDEFRHIKIKNISKGGFLLSSKEDIDIDKEISMQIYVPSVKGYDKTQLKVKAIWKKEEDGEYVLGTKFVEINEETKKILFNFIEYLIMLQNLGENIIGIPYWCIADIELIEAAPVPESKNPQAILIFESTKTFEKNKIISLDLKLPTHTMPFTVEGTVLDSTPKENHSNFWIKLGLYRLSQKHLEAVKAMTLL